MKLYEILSERKMADLYHTTGRDNAIAILDSGFINPSTDTNDFGPGDDDPRGAAISLTRDPRYVFGSDMDDELVKLEIDQGKLANTHKIVPYQYNIDNLVKQREESEERVYKPIPISYIKKIIVRDSDKRHIHKELFQLAKEKNILITFGDLTKTRNLDIDTDVPEDPIKVKKSDSFAKVIDPFLTPLQMGQFLNKKEYNDAVDEYGDMFKVEFLGK